MPAGPGLLRPVPAGAPHRRARSSHTLPGSHESGRLGGDVLAYLRGRWDQDRAEAGGIVDQQLCPRVPPEDRVLHPAARRGHIEPLAVLVKPVGASMRAPVAANPGDDRVAPLSQGRLDLAGRCHPVTLSGPTSPGEALHPVSGYLCGRRRLRRSFRSVRGAGYAITLRSACRSNPFRGGAPGEVRDALRWCRLGYVCASVWDEPSTQEADAASLGVRFDRTWRSQDAWLFGPPMSASGIGLDRCRGCGA